MSSDGDEAVEEKQDDSEETNELLAKEVLNSFASDDKKGLNQSTTVFAFWAYVAAFVSLLTLCLLVASKILPSEKEPEFFSMPLGVRQHFTSGKLLKIEVGKDRLPLKVFVKEEGPISSAETVFLFHGFGASSFTYRAVSAGLASNGLHVIAMDFPGAGLSDKPVENQGGFFANFRAIYEEILEKGLLWRFEQMFEQGSFPEPISARHEVGLRYDADELSESIKQVVSLLTHSAVHIVLHDTSVEAGLKWATQNPSLVRSITLIDTYPGAPSFPAGLLGFPGLGKMILQSSILLQMLLRHCCVTHLTQAEAASHAFLLRNNNGQRAALQTWEMANNTFDVVTTIEELGELPLHLIWSNRSGERWQELGDWLVSRLPGASSTWHNGSRWPQEDAVLEVTKDLLQFITSLPQTEHLSTYDGTSDYTGDSFVNDDHVGGSYGHNLHSCGHGHSHENIHQFDDHNMHHIHGHGAHYMDHMGQGGWVI
ncbi:hypothetical protein KP509_07G053900 [Ceratopteris richardii]|uniref:AB hydrolase-1 domain-containing protein n=1 Tax=Ceratopteris richardii TaxID=49495 RepID=A0A8T2UIB0_CERRI|nr:hypothetical protein KP509_07G053900 [Ceratopteris richardii]